MNAGLKRWLLGTTSRATLVRHWRSVIVRRRYDELRRSSIVSIGDGVFTVNLTSIEHKELRVLERVI